jgi:hypothetical protein
MPLGLDAIAKLLSLSQAAKSQLADYGENSARSAEFETGIPRAYTHPSVGDLPMAGVINPRTASAFAEWPQLAKFFSNTIDKAAGQGMGHRALSFMQKHPRDVDIYDMYRGPERGVTNIPNYPRLPIRVDYTDIPTGTHEKIHALTALANRANEAPPGLAPNIRGHLNNTIEQLLGHYKPTEIPGELFSNLANNLTRVTDRPAFGKWLWDITDPASINYARWGKQAAPQQLKKVWEGNSFYETLPSQGFSWKMGDLTDPGLRSKTIPKSFTGFFNPELNLGGYGMDLPNQRFSPGLYHGELLQAIRNKVKNAPDFDRPIQDLIDLDRHAKVRIGPEANVVYGAPAGPNDFTLVPRFRDFEFGNELSRRRAGNQTQREIDNVMSSLRELNLIDKSTQPTYIGNFYGEHFTPPQDIARMNELSKAWGLK